MRLSPIIALTFALLAALAQAAQVPIGSYPNGTIRYSDTAILVTPDGTSVGMPNGLPIQSGDSPSTDAAGRFRQSAPFGVFEDTRIDGIGGIVWEDVASGVGAASSWNSSESTVTLTVGTGPSDYLYRQSRYISYIPGVSQTARMTFVFGAGVTNTAKRVGLFDDNDGMYFQQMGSVLSMCLRSSTSGAPVDSCTAQSSWNLDHLDGTGLSGITLDVTKTQLLVVDFLWQGVGRVRYGFMIDGRVYYAHQVLNANHISVPFTSTPSLPVRYEVRNVGTTTGGTMKQICTSVESEGGYQIPGYEFSASNGTTPIGITTRAPVLAIRLTSSFGGKPNRKLLRLLNRKFRVTTNDAYCELVHVHYPYTATGGTWTAVNADSAVEYNVGLTSVTGATQHTVESSYLMAGQGQQAGGFTATTEFMNDHSTLHQNAASSQSEMFVEFCTSLTLTSSISAELNWVEVK